MMLLLYLPCDLPCSLLRLWPTGQTSTRPCRVNPRDQGQSAVFGPSFWDTGPSVPQVIAGECIAMLLRGFDPSQFSDPSDRYKLHIIYYMTIYCENIMYIQHMLYIISLHRAMSPLGRRQGCQLTGPLRLGRFGRQGALHGWLGEAPARLHFLRNS